jgi:LmbE family N-acetylglucosaminyl deacetylase
MGNFYRKKTAARQKERERSLKVFGNIKYKQLSYDDSYKVENHKFNDMAMRANIKADIKSYISEVMADMIICVDFDSHADHKMVSSLFDQIMKEMIVENGYRPLVLKKFAYLGVWGGYKRLFQRKGA